MAIHIDVVADYDRRASRGAASDLQREFQKAGQSASRDFAKGFQTESPKIEKAMNRAADSTGRLNKETERYNQIVKSGETDRVKLITAYERMSKAHRDNESAIRNVSREMSNLSSATSTAGTSLLEMGSTVAALGRVATPVAIAGLVVAVTQLAGVASAATGALGVLPGAAGAAASAFGTLKLATLGFSDALKEAFNPDKDLTKFAELLGQLSPQAQQAALAVKGLVPAFTDLKNATQDSFFANIGPQLTTTVNQMLPVIKQATTGIAGAFNDAMRGFTTELATPQTQASIQTFINNVVTAFQNLAPAVQPLTQAFATLSAAGSTVLPDLAKAAAQAAEAFSRFVSEKTATGEFQQWLQTGLDTLRQMLPVIRDVGEMFLRLAPVGERIMPDIVSGVDKLAEILPPIIDLVSRVPSGFSAWIRVIDTITPALQPVISTLSTIMDAFGMLGTPQERAERKLASAQLKASMGIYPGGGGGGYFGGQTGQGTSPSGLPPGMYRRRDGSTGYVPPPSVQTGGIPSPLSGPYGPTTAGPSDSERRKGIRAGLDPNAFAVDPFAAFNPGATSPVTGSAGAPGMAPGQISMGYNNFGQQTGYGGYQVDPQAVTEAQQQAQSQAWDLQEARIDLAVLEKDSLATEQELTDARRKVTEEGWQLSNAQADLAKAQQGTWKEMQDTAKGFASGMGDIGAQLDQDLGISKGLSGIADNLVRFLGSLAAAPLLGPLSAISSATGGPSATGSGLMGVLAMQGAFGPQYPQAYQAAMQGGQYGPSAMGPGALQPGAMAQPGAPRPGESARDFAHRVMMPYWQSQGLEVGDHAADQYGEHQQGALDIMVPDIAKGNNVLQQVLSDPNIYGAIFNKQSYGYGHGLTPQPYSGDNPHTDHVHAWYKPGESGNITPMPGAAPPGMYGSSSASLGGGSSIPIPLPVTIVGGGAGAPGGPGGGAAPPVGGKSLWDAVAQGESGGNWQHPGSAGNQHFGGLQFSPETWKAFGGIDLSGKTNPAEATREQQIEIANRTAFKGYKGSNPQGLQAFQAITKGMAPGVTANTPASAFMTNTPGNPYAGAYGTYGQPPAAPSGPPLPPPGTPGLTGGTGMPFGIPQSPVPGIAGPGVGAAPGQAGAPGMPPTGGPGVGPTMIGGIEWPSAPTGGNASGLGGGLLGAAAAAAASTAAGAGSFGAGGGAAGALAGIAISEINRAIQQAGQVAGIGVQGLMETFLPAGASELAANSWITRIAGSIGGMAPQLPNLAAGNKPKGLTPEQDAQYQQQQPVDPNTGQHGTGQGQPPGPPGPNIGDITINNNRPTEDGTGKDLSRHLMAMYGG